MNDTILLFIRASVHNDWRCHRDHMTIRVCQSGMDEYLELPEGLLEFEAVFSVEQPVDVSSFKLINEYPGASNRTRRFGISTESRVSWYDNARDTFRSMYGLGYRHISVRFNG